MSFFDPQHLYYRSQNYSHKGQVLHKKPVKRDYALTTEDLKKAIKTCEAYGYYVSNLPPSIPNLHSQLYTYNVNSRLLETSYTFKWSELYDLINNTSILREAPPGSQFSLKIRLLTFGSQNRADVLPTYNFTLSFDNVTLTKTFDASSYVELTPEDATTYNIVYGEDNYNFTFNNNLTTVPISSSAESSSLSSLTIDDIDLFREEHLPSTNAISLSLTNNARIVYVNATFIISINASY